MRIAIMQPYLFPYAGYYRLFTGVDVFVILDNVQFNRRGRVHRTELKDCLGRKQWFTLPLKKTERDTTRICDLQWAYPTIAEVGREMDERALPFPVFDNEERGSNWGISEGETPLDFLQNRIEKTVEYLGLRPKRIIRASSLKIPAHLKGQERLIAICQALGADQYVNAAGGKDLYEPTAFAARGIKLEFLPPYAGNYSSILERVKVDCAGDIRQEIMENV